MTSIDSTLDAMNEAALKLAQAVEANSGVSGWLDVTNNTGLEGIRNAVLAYRDARADFQRATQRTPVYDLDAIPSDPALDTEPECCS